MSWPYLLYLGLVFLPGLGFSELLSLWRKGEGFTERLAYAFGLGLATTTILFAFRTSGLTVGGARLVGVDATTLYLTMGVGALALALSLALRRRLGLLVKPKAADLIMLLIIILQASMVLAQHAKYPIFPAYPSIDYENHVRFAGDLLSGASTSLPAGLLYYAVHYQLAAGMLLVGGEGLVVVRGIMGLLVVISPIIVYLVAGRMTRSTPAALLITLFYTVNGTIWYGSVYNSGLYANFFSILTILFLIVCLMDLIRAPGPRTWVPYLTVLVASYFTHYTFVSLLPALLIIPLVKYLREKRLPLVALAASLVAAAPGAIALLAYPRLLDLLWGIATGMGGMLIGGTFLSSALEPLLPFLAYMALLVTDDVSFTLFFILAGVATYRAIKARDEFLLLLLAWFLLLMAAAPRHLGAWRYSFQALTPLILLASYGLFLALPKKDILRRRRGSLKYFKFGFPLLILFILLTANSWGVRGTMDALTNTGIASHTEQTVYEALLWLKDNTPSDSKYLSVSDWRFRFSRLFFERITHWNYFSHPEEALRYAKENGIRYIIVTKFVTIPLPPDPSLFPWNNFQNTPPLTLIYQNDNVKIFRLS